MRQAGIHSPALKSKYLVTNPKNILRAPLKAAEIPENLASHAMKAMEHGSQSSF